MFRKIILIAAVLTGHSFASEQKSASARWTPVVKIPLIGNWKADLDAKMYRRIPLQADYERFGQYESLHVAYGHVGDDIVEEVREYIDTLPKRPVVGEEAEVDGLLELEMPTGIQFIKVLRYDDDYTIACYTVDKKGDMSEFRKRAEEFLGKLQVIGANRRAEILVGDQTIKGDLKRIYVEGHEVFQPLGWETTGEIDEQGNEVSVCVSSLNGAKKISIEHPFSFPTCDAEYERIIRETVEAGEFSAAGSLPIEGEHVTGKGWFLKANNPNDDASIFCGYLKHGEQQRSFRVDFNDEWDPMIEVILSSYQFLEPGPQKETLNLNLRDHQWITMRSAMGYPATTPDPLTDMFVRPKKMAEYVKRGHAEQLRCLFVKKFESVTACAEHFKKEYESKGHSFKILEQTEKTLLFEGGGKDFHVWQKVFLVGDHSYAIFFETALPKMIDECREDALNTVNSVIVRPRIGD